MDSLRAAFDAYLQLVASETERVRSGPQSRNGLTVVLNPEAELRRVVESLEAGTEFKRLVQLCRRAFPDGPDSAAEDHFRRVEQFFRRSGAYCQYLREPVIDAASLFATFEGAFNQREMLVRYLAPLELMSFSRDHLDCGLFSIRHFSREELDGILQTEVKRVFYTATEIEQLCRHWFLVVEERQPAQGPSYVLDIRDFDPVVFASYSPRPAPVEKALRILSLFDWDAATTWSLDTGEAWGRFRLPFWIRVDDALLRRPDVARNSSRLNRVIRAHLDEHASRQIEQFSREIGSILPSYPEAHPWHFFEIAMTYLTRAFQTEGLDQCLWHMVAIEALVGERGSKVTEKIARRLARMLGSDKSTREDIEKEFKDLYGLRCDLVHGRSPGECSSRAVDTEIRALPGRDRIGLGSFRGEQIARVAKIRQRARQASLWFARWLGDLRRTYSGDAPLPTQEQLLSVLDSRKSRRPRIENLQQIEKLLTALPGQFPNVVDWRK
jgi:hypothetical protein